MSKATFETLRDNLISFCVSSCTQGDKLVVMKYKIVILSESEESWWIHFEAIPYGKRTLASLFTKILRQ